jgi:hypothetical protein
MLLPAKEFKKLKLRALDGDIGKAKEFYFDDHHWTVRYLVADTGEWLRNRQVLLSPYALKPVDMTELVLPVDLTKKQIEESPPLDSHQPVSRQFEMQYYSFYDWPYYGAGSYAWGDTPFIMRSSKKWEESVKREKSWDPHLRSTMDVTGYHIHALDGAIGHVADFIIDEENWSIRYLVVDTKNWWNGKYLLVSLKWIEKISWEDSKVFINLTCDAIKKSPEYNPETLNREYEAKLHSHYDKQGYWVDELAAKGR